jgi:hypothetical protein
LVEELEDRVAPAVYLVTSALDDGSPSTLRWAVTQANANPGADEIDFDIPGSGVHTIQLNSHLDITDPVTLDGYLQQPWASKNTLSAGSNAVLGIGLDLSNLSAGDYGLRITSAGA